jgi:allophanate hydrolase/aspartyl-tRNA(Asn)/glutamyl-tRNA(Gln) amidotransferase subunit A
VFRAALDLFDAAGAVRVDIDLGPFLEAGSLLYGGPWLAERYSAVGEFLAAHPDAVDPVIRAVLAPGERVTGTQVFRGLHRLRALRRATEPVWREVDMIVVPTVPTTYPVDAMLADPVRLNANLGRYTTFVNMLDLAAVAVPIGFAAGLPFGVTLIGPAGTDDALLARAADLHARTGLAVGAGAHPLVAGPVR